MIVPGLGMREKYQLPGVAMQNCELMARKRPKRPKWREHGDYVQRENTVR